VTDKIIDLLEHGTAPWRSDWIRAARKPVSLATGKPYRGINHFLLALISEMNGYASPHWLTFRQVAERGGHVRKGEKGSPCFFWKVYGGNDDDEATKDDAEKCQGKKRFVARYYTVFNIEQCDGLDRPAATLPMPDIAPVERAEAIVRGYQGPTVEHKGLLPCYMPALDRILMPERSKFFSAEGYYATLFHELVHATAHASRLDRDVESPAPFGSEDYSREELVAELGAAFLCSEAGISPPVIENQAAYLAGWLKALKDDRRAIVVAAAQAEKAVDLILGHNAASDHSEN
jgi:antirestriction protein ArdC